MPEEEEPSQSRLLPRAGGYEPSVSIGPVNRENAHNGGDYLRMVWKRKWTLLLIMIIGTAGGLTVGLRQTPRYQAQLTMEVQPPNESFLNLRELAPTQGDGSQFLQTQIGLLQSQSLLRNAIKRLTQSSDKRVSYDPSAWARLTRHLGFPAATPTYTWDDMVSFTADSLNVGTLGETAIIQITCDSPDPRIAAGLLNALSAEFIDENAQARWESMQKTDQWLTAGLDKMRRNLEASQTQLQQYAEKKDLLYTGDNANLADEKLKSLQGDYEKAQAELAGKRARKDMVDSTHGADLTSLLDLLDTGAIRNTEQKLQELQRQLAELNVSYTPAYSKVRFLRAQITEVESTLAAQRARLVSEITDDFRTAEKHAALLKAEYDAQAAYVVAQSSKAIRYNTLKHDVSSGQDLYQSMLQKVNEAGLALALRTSNVRVIDPAEPAKRPYKPDVNRSGWVGFVTGTLFGLIAAVSLETVNARVSSPLIAAQTLEVRLLGAIPSRKADPNFTGSMRRPLRNYLSLNDSANEGVNSSSLELVTLHRKPSLLAESFRTTLTSIILSGAESAVPQVLLVASPGSEEGKTMISSNLAVAVAEINKRILLIDGDMRKPRIHSIFDISNSWGLSDILAGDMNLDQFPLEALAKKTRVPGLYVLPSGPAPQSVVMLLHSGRFQALLGRLRRDFDFILIDTPPALAVADARVMSRFVDGVVLVVRANRTTRAMSLAVAQRLAEDGAPILGLILNDWDLREGNVYSTPYYYSAPEPAKKRAV